MVNRHLHSSHRETKRKQFDRSHTRMRKQITKREAVQSMARENEEADHKMGSNSIDRLRLRRAYLYV